MGTVKIFIKGSLKIFAYIVLYSYLVFLLIMSSGVNYAFSENAIYADSTNKNFSITERYALTRKSR